MKNLLCAEKLQMSLTKSLHRASASRACSCSICGDAPNQRPCVWMRACRWEEDSQTMGIDTYITIRVLQIANRWDPLSGCSCKGGCNCCNCKGGCNCKWACCIRAAASVTRSRSARRRSSRGTGAKADLERGRAPTRIGFSGY